MPWYCCTPNLSGPGKTGWRERRARGSWRSRGASQPRNLCPQTTRLRQAFQASSLPGLQPLDRSLRRVKSQDCQLLAQESALGRDRRDNVPVAHAERERGASEAARKRRGSEGAQVQGVGLVGCFEPSRESRKAAAEEAARAANCPSPASPKSEPPQRERRRRPLSLASSLRGRSLTFALFLAPSFPAEHPRLVLALRPLAARFRRCWDF